ncbi:MAG TPA: DMT family transporter [Candidatus Binatia bacterium]|nr:DMT family transporter [Candidatus Binatia bacterium]
MTLSPHSATPVYASAAIFAWGTSDFLGGYAARRANAFLFTALFNLGGLAVVLALAFGSGAAPPSRQGAMWIVTGGILGSAGVALFFKALAMGRMGLIAPVSAVLGAAIPAVYSIFTEGMPRPVAIAGFAFAAVGLWLITRTEDGNSPKGLGLAVLAGLGFAGYYLCMRQGGSGSPFWFAVLTRVGGLLVTGIIVALTGTFREVTGSLVRLAVVAGTIDSVGTMVFVLASQSGRLDEAVVISSLYPAVTVLLARIVLKEQFTRWKLVGLLAALASVPMIAAG